VGAGAQGFQGLTGLTGIVGLQGPQGLTGRGARGFQGGRGFLGVQGFTGPTGPTGALVRGPTGRTGRTGRTGPQGQAGRTGPQGDVGVNLFRYTAPDTTNEACFENAFDFVCFNSMRLPFVSAKDTRFFQIGYNVPYTINLDVQGQECPADDPLVALLNGDNIGARKRSLLSDDDDDSSSSSSSSSSDVRVVAGPPGRVGAPGEVGPRGAHGTNQFPVCTVALQLYLDGVLVGTNSRAVSATTLSGFAVELLPGGSVPHEARICVAACRPRTTISFSTPVIETFALNPSG